MTRIIENQLVIQIYIENLSRIFWQKINNEITLGLISIFEKIRYRIRIGLMIVSTSQKDYLATR